MALRIRTIDAHVGGQALRLIVEGLPAPAGRTLAARVDRLARQSDHIRRALVRPPRGHEGLTAAVLVEPVSPGAHASLLCMDGEGYPPMHGHAVIAAATIALEQRLLFAGDTIPEMRLVFDTLAGTVQATARIQERGDTLRVDSVAMLNVPSFVHTPAYPVKLGSRELRVDVAFGGIFHAIVDTEAVGIPIDAAHLPELRRLAVGVLAALDAAADVVHPADPSQRGVRALTLTSGPRDPEAHLRNVTITAGGAVDPSASVSGTSAVIAVLDAMGLLPEGQEFVHEGLTGSLLRGRALRRTQVGELPAVVTEITGTAWITGEHTFVLDDDDPFRDGFSL